MKDLVKFFDKITFAILLAISIIGIFLIYSASYTETSTYFQKQLLWLCFSIAVFFIVFRIRTELLFRYGFLSVIYHIDNRIVCNKNT